MLSHKKSEKLCNNINEFAHEYGFPPDYFSCIADSDINLLLNITDIQEFLPTTPRFLGCGFGFRSKPQIEAIARQIQQAINDQKRIWDHAGRSYALPGFANTEPVSDTAAFLVRYGLKIENYPQLELYSTIDTLLLASLQDLSNLFILSSGETFIPLWVCFNNEKKIRRLPEDSKRETVRLFQDGQLGVTLPAPALAIIADYITESKMHFTKALGHTLPSNNILDLKDQAAIKPVTTLTEFFNRYEISSIGKLVLENQGLTDLKKLFNQRNFNQSNFLLLPMDDKLKIKNGIKKEEQIQPAKNQLSFLTASSSSSKPSFGLNIFKPHLEEDPIEPGSLFMNFTND